MKTMFSRQFMLTAVLILLSIVIFGVVFRIFVYGYVQDTQIETLSSNAAAVAELAAVYDTSGQLETNWDFRINLSFASSVAGTDAVICDESGRVIICSDGNLICEHLGMTVAGDYRERVMQEGEVTTSGILEGLYPGERYVVSVPIISRTAQSAIGIVIVSVEKAQITALMSQMTDIFLLTGLIVLMLAILAISTLMRRMSQPLKDVAAAARRFGHGELDVRVETDEHNPEEIEELAVAFNNMADSLEKSEQKRKEFVANISHELKTPMTSIAGFMDGMLDGTIPPSQHRHYMQLVADEVRRLSRMVRSMLEISRLQSQGIPETRKSVFDICETAGGVLVSFEQRITAKQIDVVVDIPEGAIYTRAEKDSITQVIYNLIDNAVKFCNENGTLWLKIQPEDRRMFVSVANTGPTIPEQELSLVFDRFHKTDKSRSIDRDGVGLGLYIVKTIILSHGEDISVTSRDGVTQFTFTLPVAS